MFNLDEKIIGILDENNEEMLERIVETLNGEIYSDDERFTKKARGLLRAYLDGDVNAFCVALCGWSIENILKKSGAIEDYDQTFG